MPAKRSSVDPKDRLPAEWPDLDAEKILRRLTAAGVDFVLIGGVAVMLHGYPRVTRDVDIAFDPDRTNLETLGHALVELDAHLRGVGEDLPFVPDADTLDRVDLLTLDTSAGWLDVHKTVDGAPAYARLRRHAERIKLDGLSVLVASIDDLISMKRAAGRPVDRTDVEALEAIKRLRRAG
jgi:predicted nucleotidyltransferase